jgi:hypothetical protein
VIHWFRVGSEGIYTSVAFIRARQVDGIKNTIQSATQRWTSGLVPHVVEAAELAAAESQQRTEIGKQHTARCQPYVMLHPTSSCIGARDPVHTKVYLEFGRFWSYLVIFWVVFGHIWGRIWSYLGSYLVIFGVVLGHI